MAINLVEKYLQQVDELFKNESKRSLVTNQDYSFDGANSVRIYKVGTAAMNDYDRAGVTAGSRYGKPETLTAVTETYALPEDRSFSFVIDRLDMDETGAVLEAGPASSVRWSFRRSMHTPTALCARMQAPSPTLWP